MEMKKAITLLELLTVIIVVGILASLALPTFNKAKESAFDKEAKANLKLIQAAEKVYRMEYSTYYPSSGSEGNIDNINAYLKLLIPTTNWTYSVTGGTNSFSSRATRQGGTRSWNIETSTEPH